MPGGAGLRRARRKGVRREHPIGLGVDQGVKHVVFSDGFLHGKNRLAIRADQWDPETFP